MVVQFSHQQAIDEFLAIVDRKDPVSKRVEAQLADKSAITATTNEIKRKGLEAQQPRKKARVREPEVAPFLKVDTREERLHEKIVQHPYLLTPQSSTSVSSYWTP
jgi:hypothetical protein